MDNSTKKGLDVATMRYPEFSGLPEEERAACIKVLENHGDKKIPMVHTILSLERVVRRLQKGIANYIAMQPPTPMVISTSDEALLKRASCSSKPRSFDLSIENWVVDPSSGKINQLSNDGTVFVQEWDLHTLLEAIYRADCA